MTNKPFVLEDRYIVIKRSDLDAVWQGTVRAQFLAGLHRLNEHNVRIPQRQYLVIESDWPEFYPALQMLKARIDGAAPEAPRQSEPIYQVSKGLGEWIDVDLLRYTACSFDPEEYEIRVLYAAPLSPDHSGGAGEVLPEGWKAVPIEPTELMIRRGDQNYSWSVAKIYKAMIEDAPDIDKVKELNQ